MRKTMMTEEEADRWLQNIIENGTGYARKHYQDFNEIGEVAERLWNDPTFTLGLEYGILIAIDQIYGKSPIVV